MKYPLIKSKYVIKYDFERLTPPHISVKDSCSFGWHGEEYMMCTNLTDGGLVTLRRNHASGLYNPTQRIFPGWSKMWAPCVIEDGDNLIVFCCDTGGAEPWYKTERIKWFRYTPGQPVTDVWSIDMGHEKGVIDPEVCRINGKFVMFYVIMDWNTVNEGKKEWWDIYRSEGNHLTGPYRNEKNLSHNTEYGIEEAPCVIGEYLYWSVKDSSKDSFIRRGRLTLTNIEEDPDTLIGAVGSPLCTHPDAWQGKLRATLKEGPDYYIGEMR